ncbi:hypothetical protein [Cohnella thermotolerans]|uniref:hypothetical protein n=1 Tax=Cohnella thermotolerans TaxID=329858 RepID=UPI00047907BA|nr:hypothetical protein [Cohnella thermotolerans]
MSLELQRIRDLCERFVKKEYGLEEFQSRLETTIFPEDFKNKKNEILNELEEIRFTKLESNFYQYGLEVVHKIFDVLQLQKY